MAVNMPIAPHARSGAPAATSRVPGLRLADASASVPIAGSSASAGDLLKTARPAQDPESASSAGFGVWFQ